VLFSCKITHSVLTYLDRRGEDLGALNDFCDWPLEFLRDPSSWLEAEKMENLLRLIDQEYGRDPRLEGNLMEIAGHLSKDLRAWGVLDSVLRMVQTPKDLFAQPERLLSYFVSPAPPVGEMRREPSSVSFVLPVSEMQFPLVTTYLRAALEALPTYINKPMANVSWINSRVRISWSENQTSFFSEEQNKDLSLHPELLRNILHNLESSQKELEEMKLALIEKEREIEKLRNEKKLIDRVAERASRTNAHSPEILSKLSSILHDIYRLGDYFARGQQLITLLIAQGRQTPQVREAMRRVDWEFVTKEAPETISRTVAELQRLVELQKSLESFRATSQSRAKAVSSAQKTFDEFLSASIDHH